MAEKVTNTSGRLNEYMEMNGCKQVDIMKMCEPVSKRLNIKMNKADLSNYVNGINEPGQYKLTLLGEALGVSEVWLMGYDVPMRREKLVTELNPGESDLINMFRQLSDSSKQFVIQVIERELNR